ncbi:hypothetical protein PSN45_003840 [Yamadazyma tenuis]|uniref:LYC1 C-terminal domain-containing protein n=1 Tax=Candida tenuis (strain ATCC 10573 / BCRC 21748 / CBS 615 / JCM 9827 / NBRC 10315 / NRRL Y-1498 / VKM Y-70) TaxID=590646 RepID=G3B330_CANTC|nr:uncharacterized protein CANTEDRAFT_105103 [Yamadazyma tenuis ATCC 10573]EGV64067.1 hypothetical protein CANTEDRAFT_105103 [Yamadazyma tenuis ATCC 10573]WEJ96303.1 hypothetical protein PSN45_003840 [Yamadazyma tenuis]
MTAGDPNNYVLEQINHDGELVDFTRLQNSQAWKGILTSEEYTFRERLLGNCDMTQDLRVYVLKDINNPSEALCSIELLIRDALVYDKVDGKVVHRKVRSGCIGGVFTYKQHRRRGYARIMVNKLVDLCQAELLEDGFLFLYSEVDEFYAESGFVSMEVPVVVIPVDHETPTRFTGHQGVEVPEGSLVPLGFAEFEDVMNVYRKHSLQDIEARTRTDGKTHLTIVPDHRSFDWYHVRAKYVHGKVHDLKLKIDLGKMDQVFSLFKTVGPEIFGFKLENKGELLGFIVWTFDWTPEKFVVKVLLIHVCDGHHQSLRLKLLGYLKEYIQFYGEGFTKMEVWGSELQPTGVDLNSVGTVIPNASRSAMQMMVAKDQDHLKKGEVVWDNNNKLPWF